MTLIADSRRKTEASIRSSLYKQAGGSLIGGGSSPAGSMSDFRREAKQQEFFAQFHDWVYACTDLIARRIAGQPIHVGYVEGAAAKKGFSALKFHEGDVEVDPTHPLLDHLHSPNVAQGKFEFIYMWVINLLLSGEGYLVANGEGDEMESWAVPTNWIKPEHADKLFSGYKLQIPGSFDEPMPLDAEQVARWYLPNPTAMKNAYSPLDAVLRAVRVDDKIQESQEQMFDRGIFPNIAITIGQSVGPDGKPTGRRPKLEGHQRRQIIGAILEIWRNSVGQGDPAILDGLIEKIEKLDRSPREMDWEKSGEIVKKRICQMYRVNPTVLGETANANRAHAVVAEQNLADNTLNPLVATASEALTRFYSPKFESNRKLTVWIEPCTPNDPELRDRRLAEARKRNDITKNEWRSAYGFPADDKEDNERPTLASTVGGMTGTVAFANAVGQGSMRPEQMSQALQYFFDMEPERANAISGVGQQQTQPVLEQVDERLAAFMGSIKGLVELQQLRSLRDDSRD